MASELEPEVQAIDRSLLECSAEETAGVSAGTRAGTSGPGGPRPGVGGGGGTDSWKSRSTPALTWGNGLAGLSVLAVWVTARGGHRACPSPSFILKSPAEPLCAPATFTFPFCLGEATALPLFVLTPTLP